MCGFWLRALQGPVHFASSTLAAKMLRVWKLTGEELVSVSPEELSLLSTARTLKEPSEQAVRLSRNVAAAPLRWLSLERCRQTADTCRFTTRLAVRLAHRCRIRRALLCHPSRLHRSCPTPFGSWCFQSAGNVAKKQGLSLLKWTRFYVWQV